MGTPEFAVASLDAINKSKHNVVGVVTNVDKKSGRGQKVSFSDVKKYALENNLNLLQPKNLKDELFISELKNLKADVFVVVAFRMLPEIVWSIPPKGTINLHGSILPNYRGAAPLNWAIINGDKETGVTTFFIEKEIDTGKIIDIEKLPITENMNVGELHDKMMVLGAKTIVKTLNSIESGTAKSISQESLMNGREKLAPKIFKDTCKIDWTKKHNDIHNLVRGLSPYPVAWSILKLNNLELNVKIFATKTNEEKLEIGKLKTDNKTFLIVGCGVKSLEILEIQLPGKRKVDIKSFLNGCNIDIETDFFVNTKS